MNGSLIAFLLIILVFLGLTARAARHNRTTDVHYVSSGKISGWVNGLAMTGEYASAASFLGVTAGVALAGYNGFYLAIGVPLGVLILLLLVAEPMRRNGKYTLADMLAGRFDNSWVRALIAIMTIVLTVLYMLAQFVGAGALLALLFGFNYSFSVAVVGALMFVIVIAGGMTAATHVQALKTIGLLAITGVLLILVLSQTGWNPLNLASRAVSKYGPGAMAPQPFPTLADRIDMLSVPLALALGTAGLPHMMIRFLTVRSVRAARQSALIVCWLMGLYLTATVMVGYGAALVVGRQTITTQNPAGTLASLQLAKAVGGGVLEAVAAGITFAIIVAVLAGLTVAASGAVAHDLYTNVLRRGKISQRGQLVAARLGALIVAVGGLLLALGARSLNLAFLGSLAFALAASTTLPVILFTLYWQRFNTVGAVCGMTAGLGSTIVTLLLGPNVMGQSALFPLAQPLLVTLPAGFLAAIVGTVVTSHKQAEERTPTFPPEVSAGA